MELTLVPVICTEKPDTSMLFVQLPLVGARAATDLPPAAACPLLW